MAASLHLPVLPELPPMRCDPDCDECCSEVVPVSEAEMVRVVCYANEHDVQPQENVGFCPWFQPVRLPHEYLDTDEWGVSPVSPELAQALSGAGIEGRKRGCAVHPARPVVCRVFGHTTDDEMQCYRGYNANVNAQTRQEVIRAMTTKGPATRFLNEVQASADWQDGVDPRVWEHVEKCRKQEGLPSLSLNALQAPTP